MSINIRNQIALKKINVISNVEVGVNFDMQTHVFICSKYCTLQIHYNINYSKIMITYDSIWYIAVFALNMDKLYLMIIALTRTCYTCYLMDGRCVLHTIHNLDYIALL